MFIYTIHIGLDSAKIICSASHTGAVRVMKREFDLISARLELEHFTILAWRDIRHAVNLDLFNSRLFARRRIGIVGSDLASERRATFSQLVLLAH